jgi:hypothetical protein
MTDPDTFKHGMLSDEIGEPELSISSSRALLSRRPDRNRIASEDNSGVTVPFSALRSSELFSLSALGISSVKLSSYPKRFKIVHGTWGCDLEKNIKR